MSSAGAGAAANYQSGPLALWPIDCPRPATRPVVGALERAIGQPAGRPIAC